MTNSVNNQYRSSTSSYSISESKHDILTSLQNVHKQQTSQVFLQMQDSENTTDVEKNETNKQAQDALDTQHDNEKQKQKQNKHRLLKKIFAPFIAIFQVVAVVVRPVKSIVKHVERHAVKDGVKHSVGAAAKESVEKCVSQFSKEMLEHKASELAKKMSKNVEKIFDSRETLDKIAKNVSKAWSNTSVSKELSHAVLKDVVESELKDSIETSILDTIKSIAPELCESSAKSLSDEMISNMAEGVVSTVEDKVDGSFVSNVRNALQNKALMYTEISAGVIDGSSKISDTIMTVELATIEKDLDKIKAYDQLIKNIVSELQNQIQNEQKQTSNTMNAMNKGNQAVFDILNTLNDAKSKITSSMV